MAELHYETALTINLDRNHINTARTTACQLRSLLFNLYNVRIFRYLREQLFFWTQNLMKYLHLLSKRVKRHFNYVSMFHELLHQTRFKFYEHRL